MLCLYAALPSLIEVRSVVICELQVIFAFELLQQTGSVDMHVWRGGSVSMAYPIWSHSAGSPQRQQYAPVDLAGDSQQHLARVPRNYGLEM